MNPSIERGAATVLNAMRDGDHRWFYMTDEMVGEGVQGIIVAVYGERAEDFLRVIREWEAASPSPEPAPRKYAEACIEGDDIVIRVAISALPDAVQAGGDLGVVPQAVVTDALVFAKELVRRINEETENGTTAIHRLLDVAVTAAFEGGDEGIEPAPRAATECEHRWFRKDDYDLCIDCGARKP